ncbi:Pre-B lymphocyte protein 3, partial [Chelonia mydas]
TVQLSCTLSSAYLITHATWHQPKIGNTPKYLLWYKSNAAKHHGSGVPCRFSGSKDVANTTINQTVTDVQEDNEVDYYCGTGSGMLHSDATRWET